MQSKNHGFGTKSKTKKPLTIIKLLPFVVVRVH